MSEYRTLKAGEIIRAGDEVDACADVWRDDPKWEPASERTIGTQAPDPAYPSHRVYRRALPPPPGDEQWKRHYELCEELEPTITPEMREKAEAALSEYVHWQRYKKCVEVVRDLLGEQGE